MTAPGHGTRLSHALGCRCVPCRAVVPHGTENGYVNYKCRCPWCKRAHAVYIRAYRDAKHGIRNPGCARGLGWPAYNTAEDTS